MCLSVCTWCRQKRAAIVIDSKQQPSCRRRSLLSISFTTDGFGIFIVRTNLGAYRTHEGCVAIRCAWWRTFCYTVLLWNVRLSALHNMCRKATTDPRRPRPQTWVISWWFSFDGKNTAHTVQHKVYLHVQLVVCFDSQRSPTGACINQYWYWSYIKSAMFMEVSWQYFRISDKIWS